MTAAALLRFEPLSLDELVSEAALLTRVDRKYVVPRGDLAAILGAIDEPARVLEIDGAREFGYASVYFDTPDLLSYRMAAQPRRRRFKLRTRSYLDVGTSFLEIKTRGARGTTVKERSAYDPDRADVLTNDALVEVAGAFDAIGVPAERADDLLPTLTTRYRRATLLAADGAARATIDTDLQWIAPDGSAFELPDIAIVETKSPAAASRIDRLLWRAGHRPSTVSKYATGLAAMHPALPRNKWARLLRTSFQNPRTIPTPEEESCATAA
ncbi:polyphosphate polymerase domain-containing protein [Microbacterium terricola]|uniref:VTC domain-containing protein n=1 Tax=Microbacterium terricola TaxID=344163 RepID=A0ABM8DZZ0_9MICO|nr:polyphosphate polymerase domain-containing protein [Microbacterium terricola]UYK41019.1 polyphosphate polymerase domain-containing protein [Microbacterium terricola]BDV31224.1 VTC domain-containing protein [Microbacterium terricola]